MYNKHEIQWDQAASWSLWTPSPRRRCLCNWIGVRDWLHTVLGKISLKLWLPWEQKCTIAFKWENVSGIAFSFGRNFLKFAGIQE